MTSARGARCRVLTSYRFMGDVAPVFLDAAVSSSRVVGPDGSRSSPPCATYSAHVFSVLHSGLISR